MAEKHTEHIGFNYISKMLNIKEYNTTINKELFGSGIPDGWLLVGNSLLIIEYKPKAEMKTKGINQLARYAKKAITSKPELTIYCLLGVGSNEEEFEKLFMLYNPVDNSMETINENRIKGVFSNITNSVNCQSIHNMLVKNFHFDKSDELHDIATVIVSSFVNDELVKLYSLKNDMITAEFITLLTENARELLGNSYNKYLTVIQNTEFKNAFQICKTIYNAYKSDSHIIANMFQQFKKYNSYSLSKNEIWTEPAIAKIMYTELVNYINDDLKITNTDILTICDPCIGGGNLLTEFVNNYPNLQIKGCDINRRLIMNNKLEFIINGYDVENLYNRDYFDVNNKKLIADIVICNPPYSKNISKHDCLRFINKSLEHAKYCCYIIPKQKLLTEKKELKELLTKHSILKIINVGEIFKHVAAAGEIIILITSQKKQEAKTKYVDLSELSNEYKKVIRKDVYKFTKRGEEILNNYYTNKNYQSIEYTISVNNPYPTIDKSSTLDKIKDKFIKEYETEITRIGNLYMSTTIRNGLITKLMESIDYIKNCPSINELIKFNDEMFDFDESDTLDIRLMDYFEQVKFKATKINDSSIGDYPLFGSSKDDEPVKYINEYTIDTNGEEWIQLNKNGSVGYCFIRSGKLSATQDVYLLKLKDEYKDIINLEDNINLLSLQISNIGFGFGNKINSERLNNIHVCVNKKKTALKNIIKTENSNIKYIRLMDYFEQVKFKPLLSSYEPKDVNNCCYPLIGAKKIDNGVVKHIDVYSIDSGENDYISLCKQGNGGAGCCFIQRGKFSACSSVYILKLKDEYKNVVNLKDNIKSLSIQLTSMGFGFSNAINAEKLNDIHIYINLNK